MYSSILAITKIPWVSRQWVVVYYANFSVYVPLSRGNPCTGWPMFRQPEPRLLKNRKTEVVDTLEADYGKGFTFQMLKDMRQTERKIFKS